MLVRRADGRRLFVRRARGRFAEGYWTPVTGRLEAGESPRDAARREVLEETGLSVEPADELGRTGTDAPPGEPAPGFELVWFDAPLRLPESPIRLQESEVDEARWLTLEEALSLAPMFETTRAFLRGLPRP